MLLRIEIGEIDRHGIGWKCRKADPSAAVDHARRLVERIGRARAFQHVLYERSEQTTPPHEAGRANTAVHSITKSARAKSDRGAARFCALTIFKLMRLAYGPRSAACPSKLGADRRRGGDALAIGTEQENALARQS